MVRFSAIFATALALVATSSASPITADQPATFNKGLLYVVGVEAEAGQYNKSASINDNKLKIQAPTESWSLSVLEGEARDHPYIVLVRQDSNSCLTAHKLSGASYLYLDQCYDQSSKTGDALTDLENRQRFYASPQEGTALYLSQITSSTDRPWVHIIESTKEVHLLPFNGTQSKQLTFQPA